MSTNTAETRASRVIKLNVGGKIFTTTTSTLLKGSSSEGGFFSSLFSGRFTTEKDEDGCIFIDRSGQKFEHVLEFLRTGSLSPDVDLDDILHEAQFYLLDDLIHVIEQRKAEIAVRNKPVPKLAVRFDGIYKSTRTGTVFAFLDSLKFVMASGEDAVPNIIGFLLGSPVPAKWKQRQLDEAFARFCIQSVRRGTYWQENETNLTLLVDTSRHVAAVATGDRLLILGSDNNDNYTFEEFIFSPVNFFRQESSPAEADGPQSASSL